MSQNRDIGLHYESGKSHLRFTMTDKETNQILSDLCK